MAIRGRGSQPTADGYKQNKAETIVTKNDKEWVEVTPEDRERQADLKKLSTISFWGGIPANDYNKVLKDVIPTFWDTTEVQTLVRKNQAKKTQLQRLLSPYLKKIVEIADGKIPEEDYLSLTCGLSLENTSGRFERLAFFLKVDNTDLPEISRMASRAKTTARKAIFTANGVQLLPPIETYSLVNSEDDLSQEQMEENGRNDGV